MRIRILRLDGSIVLEGELYREWAPLNYEIISAILPAKARAYPLDSYAIYFTLGVRVLLEKPYEKAEAGDIIVIPYTNSIAVVVEPVEKIRFKSTLMGRASSDLERLRQLKKGEPMIVDRAPW